MADGLLAFSDLRVLTSSVLSFNASLRAVFSQYILQNLEKGCIIFEINIFYKMGNQMKKKLAG